MDPEPFEVPEVSGIAGSALSTNFSHEFASSLVARHGSALRIDWDTYERPDRLGPVLAKLLPAAFEDWSVEPHIDWRSWFETARCSLPWLLAHVDPATYDALEIPLRWEMRSSSAARSLTRIARRHIFYHDGAFLKRSDVSIEQEFLSPAIVVKRLSSARARTIMDTMIDTSAVRYREVWGFTSYPDCSPPLSRRPGARRRLLLLRPSQAVAAALPRLSCRHVFQERRAVGIF